MDRAMDIGVWLAQADARGRQGELTGPPVPPGWPRWPDTGSSLD